MNKQVFVIVAILDEKDCKGIKNLTVKDNGKAEVFITKKTTARDAEEGRNVFAISGKSGLVVTEEIYGNRLKDQITEFMNDRFGSNWEIVLKPAIRG